MFRLLTFLQIGLLMAAGTAHAWKPEIGEAPANPGNVEYTDGTKVSLEKLRGHPTVLYFGGDWCEPCRTRGYPAIKAAHQKYKAQGLQFVFFSMDDNALREHKAQEAATTGIPIAMPALDTCPPRSCPFGVKDLVDFGRIYKFPTAIILDSKGIVRSKLETGRGVESGIDAAISNVLNH
ncbi:peroxiredoxin family protein [Azohydromonas aeria]|uniref:peroxiredoxin family protein n=1 Tax=Azohydromonas aeria TaxID=2590212 RepID=UPI0012FA964F|nr:TlpA disulfide reductase family protein [Azohydromonas aeria]